MLNNTTIINTVTPSKGGLKPRSASWLRLLGEIFATIVSAIARALEYLFNLTVIRIPMPGVSVYENSNNTLRVDVVSLLYSVLMLGAITSLAFAVAYVFYRRKHRTVYPQVLIRTPNMGLSTPRGSQSSRLASGTRSLEELLLGLFSRLLEYAKNRLGLNESITPRELALALDNAGFGDDIWIIEAALEELRYGGRKPKWLSLNEVLDIARRVEEKLNA